MDFLTPRRLLCALLLALAVFSPAAAQSREYKLKAAFIYNFIKFIEWPSQTGAIKVGILGEDPFKGELKKLERKKVGGRPLQVSKLGGLGDAKSYQVVFATDPAQAAKLVKAVEGKPVLTISDAPEFTQNGGGIALTSSRNRIRFSINKKTLERARLKASSKLLGLAAELHG